MEYQFSPRVQQASSYAAHERRRTVLGRNVISFVDELPAGALLPKEAIREAEMKAATGWGAGTPLHRGVGSYGYEPFRETIATRMAARGMPTSNEQVIATTGVQHAVDAAARALTVPGDAVLVETPTNPSVLRTFAMNGLHVIATGIDGSGIDLEDAERLILSHQPKMIYTVPTFGAPAGQSWSLERRQGLIDLARTYGVPIIEDDSNRDLSYQEQVQYPALYTLAGSAGGVLYLNTFAGVLPELRIGWAAGDSGLIASMSDVIGSSGTGASVYEQRLLCGLLKSIDLDAHIRKLAFCYSQRMSRLTRLLEENGPAGLEWDVPLGGSSLWLRLPDGLEGEALLRGALRKEVAFEPGTAFFAGNPQCNTARLSVSSIADNQLERGVKLFLETIGEFTARS
ncbi:aminotransferase-like domain-containing protein [Paenibacillus kobensis]|uniref:aminotransferase-like domain-containing protein n=1 Tax=Paenibacillus kobensis TaxID=59841 RepID=UPI000FD99469|nr:PLP-dependent aminotransferase family protein [Paenibacillus kobensis]